MFFSVVFSLVASTFALPALELPKPPKVIVTPEAELNRLQLNTETPLINANEGIEVTESHLSNSEKQDEKRRLYEEERRIIEEGKRIIDEEKRIIEEKRLIEEEVNKIIEDERRVIEEEEKKIIEVEEQKLIKEEKTIMEEEQERKNILPAIPSPPELPAVDQSILTTFLKANKLEDSQDASKNVKPYIFMWKLPRIIFPGRYLIDNI